MGEESRIWNTFDAHRLLHWAGTVGMEAQRALKAALFRAHFTEGKTMTDAGVLADAAAAAGLDRGEAEAVLAEGRYADAVRAAEALWVSRGITGVPAVEVEVKWLISGGQPAGVFEEALRRMAGEGCSVSSPSRSDGEGDRPRVSPEASPRTGSAVEG